MERHHKIFIKFMLYNQATKALKTKQKISTIISKPLINVYPLSVPNEMPQN